MPQRRKVIGLGLVAVAAVAVGIVAAWLYGMRPMSEQEVLATDHLEFVREVPIPDGGSYVFDFQLPHKRTLAIQVVHRRAELGGNPDFQEIRLLRFRPKDPYIDLRPGSPLETKLLSLLESASIVTNATITQNFTAPAPERLRWLMDRIRDRNAQW